MIAVTAVLACAASVLYLRLASPTFTAQAQVLLGIPRAQFVQQQSLLAEPAFDVTQIETQLQILKSKAIAAIWAGWPSIPSCVGKAWRNG